MSADHFGKNIVALSLRYPKVAGLIAARSRDSRYQVEVATTGTNGLYFTDDGRTIVLERPGRSRDTLIAEINGQPFDRMPRILVLYGLGLGYYLDIILENRHPDIEAIVVIEKDLSIFQAYLETNDRLVILEDQTIHFFVGVDPVHLKQEIFGLYTRKPHYYYLESIQNLCHHQSILKDNEYYLSVARIMKEAKTLALTSFGNDSGDCFLGQTNFLENLSTITRSHCLQSLKGRFSGIPGLIVASGPSMNLSIDRLAGLRERCLMVCCDSALHSLLAKGCRPHFVASLERYPELVDFFRGYPIPEDIQLLSLAVQTRQIYENFPGNIYFSAPELNFCRWLIPELPTLCHGPTVSTMAYISLLLFGCSPILIVGNDLAYDTADGTTHMTDVLLDYDPPLEKESPINIIESIGNSGKPVRTKYAWNMFREYYEYLIGKNDTPFINIIPESHGLRIAGALRMDLDKAIDTYLQKRLDLVPLLAAPSEPPWIDSPTTRKTISEKIERALRYLDRLLVQIGDIAKRIEEGRYTRIQELEITISEIITQEPLFQEIVIDMISPFHVPLLNRYYAIPGQQGVIFKQKVEIWKTWLSKTALWTEKLKVELERVRSTSVFRVPPIVEQNKASCPIDLDTLCQ